jgi:hypothetical protein
MKPRTRARSLALQVLYEVDVTNHLPGLVFKNAWRRSNLKDKRRFEALSWPSLPVRLFLVSSPLTDKLDSTIARYAPEWPFDQIAAVDRNILRIAAWEFAVSRQRRSRLPSTRRWNWRNCSVPTVPLALLMVSWAAWPITNMRLRKSSRKVNGMEILGVGVPEMAFILLIALILLGPKDMIAAGRTLVRRCAKSSPRLPGKPCALPGRNSKNCPPA